MTIPEDEITGAQDAENSSNLNSGNHSKTTTNTIDESSDSFQASKVEDVKDNNIHDVTESCDLNVVSNEGNSEAERHQKINSEDESYQKINSEDESYQKINSKDESYQKINSEEVSVPELILNEDNEFENEEIDEEIDDALDEGYMGMECTLERGFSLNESAMEKEFYSDLYDEMTIEYLHKPFPKKYSSSLKHFIPVRKPCKDKDKIKVDSAGLFSFISFSWISGLMWKAFREGLKEEDIPLCSKYEMCNINTQRLNVYWKEEIQEKGMEKATLYRPVWRFVRTRIIVTLLIMWISLIIGFIAPTFFMRYLIAWLSTDEPVTTGVIWALSMILCEVIRILTFASLFAMNYRTATRLRAACLGLVYKKLMCMSNLGHKSIGEVVNLFANDGQRIHDFITLGTFFFGGIFIAIAAVFYILFLLGPWALLGMASFLFFYPFQYLISRLSGYLRRKAITVTDQRVRMMNEIFTCVKLIKMYAWEKCFKQTITDIRDKERKFLEKSAYVNSLSIATTPVVPVVAAIITFLAHIGAGNNLTAAQAFSIVAVLLGNVRISLNMLRCSVLTIVEFRESVKRLQSILSMRDMENYIEKTTERDCVISLMDVTFAWTITALPFTGKKKKVTKLQKKAVKENAESKLQTKLLDENPEKSSVEVLRDLNLEIKKVR